MQVTVITTNGEFVSDITPNENLLEETGAASVEEALKPVFDLLQNIKEMEYFRITINGSDTYFHPDHIVAVKVGVS